VRIEPAWRDVQDSVCLHFPCRALAAVLLRRFIARTDTLMTKRTQRWNPVYEEAHSTAKQISRYLLFDVVHWRDALL
jgi:hypothetical protein